MPLVRKSHDTALRLVPPVAPPAEPTLLEERLAHLAGPDITARRRAARELMDCPAAAGALAACLAVEAEPSVRDTLFDSLIEIGGAPVAALVAPLIRSDDAGLRGGAIEALKRLGLDAVAAVDALLDDDDADLRLLVIEVTRGWPAGLATPRLARIIAHDPHVNVCGAAVEVASENGTADLLPSLAAARLRFAGEPFLVFALDIAAERIRACQTSV
jgi:hypothetical protein